jgi:hypothetical protein
MLHKSLGYPLPHEGKKNETDTKTKKKLTGVRRFSSISMLHQSLVSSAAGRSR